MEYVFLRADRLAEPVAAQRYLAQKLRAPAYYGHNLDALYDVMTQTAHPLTVILYGDSLPDYAARVARVLRDAAAENAALHVAHWDM